MKRTLTLCALFSSLLLLMGGAIFTGCQDEDFGYTFEEIERKAFYSSGISDFKMTGLISVDLDFDAPGARNPVRIYTENPYDEEGNLVKGVEPIFAFFLENGAFKGSFADAKANKTYYIAVGGIGLPTLLEATVENGRLIVNGDQLTRASYATVGTLTKSGTLAYTNYHIIKATDSDLITCTQNSSDGLTRADYSSFYNELYALFPWSISGYPNPTQSTDSYKTGGYYIGDWKGTVGKNDNSTDMWDNSLVSNVFCLPQNAEITLKFKNYTKGTDNWNNWNLALQGTSILPSTEYFILRADNYGWRPGVDNSGFNATSFTGPSGWNWNWVQFKTDMNEADVTITITRTGTKTTVRAVMTKESNTYEEVFQDLTCGTDATKPLYAVLRADNAHLVLDDSSKGSGEFKKEYSAYASFTNEGISLSMSFATTTLTPIAFTGTTIPANIHSSGQETNAEYGIKTANNKDEYLKISVPAGTLARMTLVFDAEVDANFYLDEESKSRKHGSNTDLSGNSSKNVYACEIMPGEHSIKSYNKKNILCYVRLDYIEEYHSYGTINQTVQNYAIDNSVELQKQKNRLTNTLWRETGSKSDAKSLYGEAFNSQYASTDQDKNNITVTENNTELYVTFLDEYDMTASNVFGYYYYPKNNKPQTPEGLKKIIVFPNCTSTNYNNSRKYKGLKNDGGNNVYDYATSGAKEYAPLQTGAKVQLMYYDETQSKFVKEFPKDVIVGWFIIYNGFDAWQVKGVPTDAGRLGSGRVRLGDINNFYEGRKQPDTKIYYSDPQFNSDAQARCIQFTDSENDAINLCFEDSYDVADGHSGNQDWTYDDLLITVSANPGKIENNSGHKTTGGSETLKYKEVGTLLFEDIWDGNRTDFDMNDVVVEYNHSWTIVQETDANDVVTSNKITKVIEQFKVVNDGGTYQDGFAIKTPYVANDVESISLSINGAMPAKTLTETTGPASPLNNEGRYEVDDDGKIILVPFDNINGFNQVMGTVYDFTITFKSGNEPSPTKVTEDNGNLTAIEGGYTRDDYNPFIIVYNWDGTSEHSGANANKRCEIHLTNKLLTSRGYNRQEWGVNNNNRWNVAKLNSQDLYVPFGLDLPIPSFVGCRENVLVTDGFGKFADWAKNSKENTDWYLYPANDSKKIGWDLIK